MAALLSLSTPPEERLALHLLAARAALPQIRVETLIGFCINRSLILNNFYNTALFDKKRYPSLIRMLSVRG